MNEFGVDMYLIPSTDAHNSEYVPKCWQRRTWISNFDGSAGEVLVTKKHAYLWTDGRYFLMAERQLDESLYSLMKQTGFVPKIGEWLVDNARGKTLGVDPKLLGIDRAFKLKELMESIGGELLFLDNNLVDLARIELDEKVELPNSSVFYLEEQYTGVSLNERLNWIRNELLKTEADYIVLNVLDEIAWLFNIRGADIRYNPLVISYAIIGKHDAILFIDSKKLGAEVKNLFTKSKVRLLEYDEFANYLLSMRGKVILDGKTANYWMFNCLSHGAKVNLSCSPIVHAKAIKNKVEVEGAYMAHILDAKAVIGFLSWLDKNWQNGVDEITAADRLSQFRSEALSLRGDSFATISGFKENGAVIHYHATVETNKIIDNSSLYLVDSGGQYLEGTTDITRTIHLGDPTAIQKRHYTLVLKGHLALARAIFPHGTCGEHLDVLARGALWRDYLDYRHGTGHGVGSFLCVHEGPQRISQAISGVVLVPGMIVSNEPGLYLDNKYGIRIENLCLVKEIAESRDSDYGVFYTFENLTHVPYCKKLIDIGLLTEEEKSQILSYYEQICQKVRPNLSLTEQIWLDNELNLF